VSRHPGTQRISRQTLTVLVGVSLVALFGVAAFAGALVKGSISATAALRSAQAAEPKEPARALTLLEQAGLANEPRAPIQLVGARIVLARCALVHGELAKAAKELEGLATDDDAYFLTRAEIKLRRDDAEAAIVDLARVRGTGHELHLLRAAALLATNDLQGSL